MLVALDLDVVLLARIGAGLLERVLLLGHHRKSMSRGVSLLRIDVDAEAHARVGARARRELRRPSPTARDRGAALGRLHDERPGARARAAGTAAPGRARVASPAAQRRDEALAHRARRRRGARGALGGEQTIRIRCENGG